MVNYIILAGGYTTFIVTYLLNCSLRSCTLSVVNKSPTGPNPSWIASHPTNRSILYATNENTNGGLQSFTILPGGVLSDAVETVSTGGDSPAFVAPLSTGEVIAVNYGSGNGHIFPTTPDGQHFDAPSSPLVTFPILPPKNVSHPHMVVEHDGEIFVPDLGGDRVWRLVPDGSPGSWRIQGQIDQPDGSGPRHIAISDNFLYVIHEISSTLSVQEIPAAPNGTSPVIDSVSITPADAPTGAVFAAAEILVPARSVHFPVSYIYASNRNIGVQDARGDTIAVFCHDRVAGALRRVADVYTGLDQVRGMQIGGVGDGYLIAAGNAGGGVVVYRRLPEGGLQEVARNVEVLTRSSFVWL